MKADEQLYDADYFLLRKGHRHSRASRCASRSDAHATVVQGRRHDPL